MKKHKKNGISLIVLVITIIVMIILATAIIISINNAGVINNANKAVNDTSINNIKIAADLSYSQFLINKVGNAEEFVNNKLISDGIINEDKSDYYIKILNNEVIVVTVGSTADKYFKGEIQIGDYIEYDPTMNNTISKTYSSLKNNNMYAEQTYTNNYNGKWQIIGMTAQENLEIISEESVGTFYLSSSPTGKSYFSAVGELNNICSIYGYGEGAAGARSVKMEDVYGDSISSYEIELYWEKEDINIVLGVHSKNKNTVYKTSQINNVLYIENNVVKDSIKPQSLASGSSIFIVKEIGNNYDTNINNIPQNKRSMYTERGTYWIATNRLYVGTTKFWNGIARYYNRGWNSWISGKWY